MNKVSKLNPALAPRAIAAITERIRNGNKLFAVFQGLIYEECEDGIWHVAPLRKDPPFENTWTDEGSFGFPPVAAPEVEAEKEVKTFEVEFVDGRKVRVRAEDHEGAQEAAILLMEKYGIIHDSIKSIRVFTLPPVNLDIF